MTQPLPDELSSHQLATVHLCAQEESSVIEALQEIVDGVSDIAHMRVLLIDALCSLSQQRKIGFFLDDFASGALQDISLEEAHGRMGNADTWDMHNLTQLHIRWLAN